MTDDLSAEELCAAFDRAGDLLLLAAACALASLVLTAGAVLAGSPRFDVRGVVGPAVVVLDGQPAPWRVTR